MRRDVMNSDRTSENNNRGRATECRGDVILNANPCLVNAMVFLFVCLLGLLDKLDSCLFVCWVLSDRQQQHVINKKEARVCLERRTKKIATSERLTDVGVSSVLCQI